VPCIFKVLKDADLVMAQFRDFDIDACGVKAGVQNRGLEQSWGLATLPVGNRGLWRTSSYPRV
jgi:hypothetical protein